MYHIVLKVTHANGEVVRVTIDQERPAPAGFLSLAGTYREEIESEPDRNEDVTVEVIEETIP